MPPYFIISIFSNMTMVAPFLLGCKMKATTRREVFGHETLPQAVGVNYEAFPLKDEKGRESWKA